MSSRRESIRRNARVAYMEETDSAENIIQGTETYAASVAPSPTKERMNTSRKKSRRGDSSSPNVYTDSDSTAHPSAIRRDSKTKSRDKDKAVTTTKKAVATLPRPANKHSRTAPAVPIVKNSNHPHRRSRDESLYYGVDPTTVTSAASHRPRAQTTATPRPSSYYGGSMSRPPLSNAKYHTSHGPLSALPTSYPPQSWAGAGAVSYPLPPPPIQTHQPDYFHPRPPQHQLMARFDRPASAMSHRVSGRLPYADEYEQDFDRPLVRQSSLTRRQRVEEDRVRMPPPPPPQRPMSARPLTIRSSPFAPPPRRYDDESFDGDGGLYHDVSPLTQQVSPYDYSSRRLVRTRRPSVGANSVVYDSGPYATEVATTANSRRNSYYNDRSASSGSGFEDKLRQASSYQDEVNGGASLPLTAETLRRASKHGGASSRSTRSSGSHDESDWRQSATTRTTQSNDEDVTIRVKGGATLKYGGAEMECQNGAEISISSRGPGGVRSSSDKSSFVDPEERQARLERRTSIRNRATSQAPGYGRTPRYDYQYNGYDYTPSPFAPNPPPGGFF